MHAVPIADSPVLLDSGRTLLFNLFGVNAGAIESDQKSVWRKVSRHMMASKAYRAHGSRIRQELLSAALVSGHIHLLQSPLITQSLSFSTLSSSGLQVTIHPPYDRDRLPALNRAFTCAYRIARRFEGDARTAPLLSFDDWRKNRLSRMSDSRFEALVNVYDFYLTLLHREIDWPLSLSGQLSEHFFRSAGAWQHAFEQKDAEWIRTAGAVVVPRTPTRQRSHDLSVLMDLAVRSAAEIERADHGELRFPPDYFESFEDIQDLWGEPDDLGLVEPLKRHMGAVFVDPDNFGFINGLWRSALELRQLLTLSSTHRASILVPRTSAPEASEDIGTNSDALQLFRLYIAGVSSLPTVDTVDDLMRLHHHRALRRFREKLQEWSLAARQGDGRILTTMRRDFQLATSDLRRVARVQRVGNIMTVVALPVGVASLLTGLPLDFGFTALGPALLGYAALKEQSAMWVRFGSLDL